LIEKRKIIDFKIVALSVMLMLPLYSIGQDSNFGNWMIYFGNKKINSKWNIHNEVQYRNYNAIGDLEQLLLRVGLGYNLTEKTNILLGYGYILSENYIGGSDEKEQVNENRIYQQLITKQNYKNLTVQHRYRFEQRFVEDDFRLRLRYFLGVNIPLSKKETNRWYLSAYNEIFLNTESPIFDRNRLYGGFGYKINDSVRMELGYMNQFFEIGSTDQLNIITFVNF
jgi:opacity protein-like surface antigen